MDKEKVMQAMEHIDVDLIAEAAGGEKAARKHNWRKVAVIAACMCLVLAGTVLAVKDSGLLRFFNGNEWMELTGREDRDFASGHWASSTVKVPASQLSDEVKTLAAEQDTEWRVTWHSFGSWSSAEEFIGIETANQPILDAANKVIFKVDTDNGEVSGNCILQIWQNDSGISELVLQEESILYDKDYVDAHFAVMRRANVITDLAVDDPNGINGGMGYGYTEEQFKQTKMLEYTMKNGLVATVISRPIRGTEDELFGREFIAYFQEDNAMISVRMVGLCYSRENDYTYLEEETFEKLKEVLDAFE